MYGQSNRTLGVAILSQPQGPAVTKLKLRQLWSRMLKVLRFNSETYVDVRNDEKATGQAVAALFVGCLSLAFGFTVQTLIFFDLPLSLDAVLVGILTQLLESLLATLVWAFMLFLVGTKIFKGKVKFWQLARPFFFSVSPAMFFFLIAIPIYAFYVTVTITLAVWIVVGGVVALKNSMGFDYNRSMLTHTVGFLIALFVYYSFVA